jgi:hypothetical protein
MSKKIALFFYIKKFTLTGYLQIYFCLEGSLLGGAVGTPCRCHSSIASVTTLSALSLAT